MMGCILYSQNTTSHIVGLLALLLTKSAGMVAILKFASVAAWKPIQ